MKHVLIGKFSHGRPAIALMKEFFCSLNLKGEYNLSLYDTKHLFIECPNGRLYSFMVAPYMPLMHETWIGFEEDSQELEVEKDGFWQKVLYDAVPGYCKECHHLGHKDSSCKRSKGKEIAPSEPLAIQKPLVQSQERPTIKTHPQKATYRARPDPRKKEWVPTSTQSTAGEGTSKELELKVFGKPNPDKILLSRKLEIWLRLSK
ncbi:hypothetical protein LIER_14135 [Lithospermum erythrorhizon]|uniref:DUF4283 domain-containing protein n=1 Tax=Lithospermum erythrorhizon TaxID=34254 RepID=A0AAV3Q2M2_LITER